MAPFETQEFGASVLCDNRLAAERIACGETVELSEVVELAAICRSLYNLATLTTRELGRVDDRLALWSEIQRQFSELCQAWDGVPPNGDATAFHRAQLSRLRELARDRCELYSVAESERLIHAANREPDLGLEFKPFSERSD